VLVAATDRTAAEGALARLLAGDTSASVSGLYRHTGVAAVRHLARVAAGLDSVIVGEAEVSGQIRRALAAARAAGAVGPVLERVIAGVLRASGRARSETRIGQGVVSAATAGVSLLERAFGSLHGRTVVALGAGEAGRQALGRLAKRRVGRLLVASRSVHHATAAAKKTGAEVVHLDCLGAALAEADGLVAATRAPGFQFLVDAAMCRDAMASRPERALAIVDLSVPRVVDPAVAGLAGVTLHTVDDLGDVVRESVRRREREIPRVERIVADEAARTYEQFIDRRDRRRVAVA
jgi:glutamyl-tRNA reductase